MGKFVDLTGQRFGRLTVIERAENMGHGTAWLCRCDCGNIKEIRSNSLRRGATSSCGCALCGEHPDKIVDLSGQRFGRLTVIKQAGRKNGKIAWLCKCDCNKQIVAVGNSLKSGNVKSCGCYSTEVKHRKKFIDFVGKKFGRLTVIERVENRGNVSMWRCECACGNSKIVSKKSLVGGYTTSCGCYGLELKKGRYIDLKGQRFGKLTVLERVEKSRGCWEWRCLCDCGNETIASTGGLRSNITKTCGYCNPKKKRYTREQLIQLLQKYVENNGYPTNLREVFTSKNGMPSTTAYVHAFGGNMKDWLSLCGYDLADYERYKAETRENNHLSKNECVKIIYSMQEKLDRPLMYADFHITTKDTLGITEVKRHWGSLNKMKKELGLEITQENMMDKALTKERFDKEVEQISDYLKNDNRDFITTREIDMLPFCSGYLALHRGCMRHYHVNLPDFLIDRGIVFGKRGRGLSHTFDDGECATSQYEYIFSRYLREYGFRYGDDYLRDVKYSLFVSDYDGNMNCDYVIHHNNRTIYIEIAGVIDEYKKWYYLDKPISKSKSKEEYRQKLRLKERLLQSEQLEYYFLFPCDLTKDVLKMILESEDYSHTRKTIEKFNKNNIKWDKVLTNGELRYDYSRIGRDKQPIPVY